MGKTVDTGFDVFK